MPHYVCQVFFFLFFVHQLSDDGAPQINTEVCVSDMTTNWHSITSNVSVVFSSDAAVSQGGFSFIAVFLPCSDYGYVIDNFGVVSIQSDIPHIHCLQ